MKRNRSNRSIAGFTLIEVLVIIIMVGILFAIAAPSWVGFINRQRLTTARDQTFELLRSAQAEAKRTKVSRAIAFDNAAQKPRVIVVPVVNDLSTPTIDPSDGRWQVLGNGDIKSGAIKISGRPDKGAETSSGTIVFDTYGNVSPKIGAAPYTITIQATTATSPKRCVRVTTLIGAMVTAEDSDCNL